MVNKYKSYILTLLLVAPAIIYSQKTTYSGMIVTDSIPDELLPSGAAEIGFVLDEDRKPAGFGYQQTATKYKLVSKKIGDFSDFEGRGLKSYYHNDTLFFIYRKPFKALTTELYYTWDGKKLNYIGKHTHDPSKEAVDNGEAALRKGEIREAAEYYNQVEYANAYIVESVVAMHILGIAHYLAMGEYMAGNPENAVQLMDDAFVYHFNQKLLDQEDEFGYHKFVMDNFPEGKSDSLGSWISDYSFLLLEADSLEKAVTIATYMTKCYPKTPDAWLHLGDALYKQDNQDEAKEAYSKYDVIMRGRGDESLIPERVSKRM